MSYESWECGNCGGMSCQTCGQHFCADECGACGRGCRCYCYCPTMRDDDGDDFWS